MYEQVRFSVRGIVPLLMHNGQLADAMNPMAKEVAKISKKRNKTDDDYMRLAYFEALGGLWLDEGRRVVVPGEALEAMVLGSARKRKLGPSVKSGVLCDGNFPLEYNGPKDPEKLASNEAFRKRVRVRVPAAVMRTRPMFPEWGLSFVVDYLPDQIDYDVLVELVETGGRIIGLGDWRPRYGRFTVEKVEA